MAAATAGTGGRRIRRGGDADSAGGGREGEGVMASEFDSKVATPTAPVVDVKELHAKIGQLTLENDFLEGALTKAG